MVKEALIFLAAALSLQAVGAESVWMEMDQQALDDAYDQRVYAANLTQVLARFKSNSEAVRAKLGEPLRLAYGAGADERMDVYTTDVANAPIHIFIHGGAWRMGVAKDNAHAAEMFVRNGIHFVVPDFSPVQNFEGRLEPMVEQLRAAVIWIYRNAGGSFDGDVSRIYLSGFSSGGHLASVLLTTDWSHYGEDLPLDLFKGSVLCSGMYDLVPVSLSARRHYVNFTDETIERLSAIRHIDQIHCPVVVAYGTEETPEFQRQAQAFAQALIQGGVDAELLVAEHYNHFEVIETMANPYRLLGEAALKQIVNSK
jgi:arylformamidase